ncbi:hypothetical protein JW911_01340 [Candidatus Peregrinibacteria bacterium]|nr:hypothetical protein [Candidatus Peregrinibacteria bacterium]
MKKILLYSLGVTLLTMVVSALFVFGVINFSSGTTNLIGAGIGLHGSHELEIHNQIVEDIHFIGNKIKWLYSAINVEGDITDEAIITSFITAGEGLQEKLNNLTALFNGNTYTNDKQIIEDTFKNDYKPALEELSYLLTQLEAKKEENTEVKPDTSINENIDKSQIVGEAVSQAKYTKIGTAIKIILPPITLDKKTEIKNSCAKLIEAHNKFSDVLNQKRRY